LLCCTLGVCSFASAEHICIGLFALLLLLLGCKPLAAQSIHSSRYNSSKRCALLLVVQVEVLLEWLLRRGRELNATAQLGPQALGATAGALARLQEAQRQQQRQQQEQLARQRQQQQLQQQQQQQQQQARSVRQRVLEEEEAKRADAAADRRQLMQQLVDAAVAQRSRLSP
jgi:hypothetical protein